MSRIFGNPVLHQIDVKGNQCNKIDISINGSDLEPYLKDLLEEIEGKPQRRAYTFPSESTEFFSSLISFYSNHDLQNHPISESLAERLLRIERSTEDRYGHLAKGKDGLLKKGSFLQFILSVEGRIEYIGIKVEHEGYIDETDFIRRIGLGEEHKIYKACRVSFDSEGTPTDVLIYDTNNTPSSYWWRDMLELTEKLTDEANTEKAIKEVVKKLNPLRKISLSDYTLLRNAAITSFKQEGEMDFDNFVTRVFQDYKPVDDNAQVKIREITSRIRELPEKKGFDGKFDLVPSVVPYKKRTVKASNEITIKYDEDIQNIEDKIWSTTLTGGEKVVVIKSEEAYEHFRKG